MHSISPYGINAFNVFAVLLFVYLPALSSVCLFVRLFVCWFVCLFVCLRLALAHRFQKSKLKYEPPVEIYMRIIGERLRENDRGRVEGRGCKVAYLCMKCILLLAFVACLVVYALHFFALI